MKKKPKPRKQWVYVGPPIPGFPPSSIFGGGGGGRGGNSWYTRVCECGGRTGICGTPQGANAWRAHIATQRHQDWFEKQYAPKPANKEKEK